MPTHKGHFWGKQHHLTRRWGDERIQVNVKFPKQALTRLAPIAEQDGVKPTPGRIAIWATCKLADLVSTPEARSDES